LAWADFEQRYLHREDGFKYEWVHGFVEKSLYAMNVNQLYIVDNLRAAADALRLQDNSIGTLYAESDFFLTPTVHRRPDLAYLTPAQVKAAANNSMPIPAFVVEIISQHDAFKKVNHKLEQYFQYGVQVVWHIIPEEEIVHVYENRNTMRICRGDDLCSAEPAIPGLQISAKDVFRK